MPGVSLAYKIEGSGSAFEQKDVLQTKYRQITFNSGQNRPTPPSIPQAPQRSYRDNNRYALSREGSQRAATQERPAIAFKPETQEAPPIPVAETAPAPVSEPEAEPSPVPTTGANNSDVVAVAMGQQGKPYRYGAAGPNSFDCSGLTKYCFAQVGIELPHSSSSQSGLGEAVARENLQPGDLVFFGGSRVNHAGIYVGDGNFIHAPSSGEKVRVQPLSSHGGYIGARRVK